ncbi:MAG: Uridylate kinase [candidate division CPR2 bacterium GW2011_GWC1_41_48]|uniref:Uridylate kinase n=1 Tax=candidate division CPR2 bacterium GW2011_GWC1_41_48 TaxID=1618344 RepID=A0A0G0W9F5_UNCC2|nr:MAG: Uridylate kinase [candidate division CPR2 bacterium GW2011_GWC2_39_35]KKS09619.1 MAG: Uridylate kinase [candidate division CPR2 bacterium GW2011_GWC1_41_48]
MKYKRIMLKLSGEAFLGDRAAGIDPEFTLKIAKQIKEVYDMGTELCIVIGGGNIFRGLSAAEHGLGRTTGDYIGMLATVMNSLALQESLEKIGLEVRVQTALTIIEVAEPYIRRKAVNHIKRGRIVIFGAGSGNPYVTTDMAAVLRALEMDCEVIFKATKVDGVYDKDPAKHEGAVKYDRLKHDEVLINNLKVMDPSAIALARENETPIIVFDINKPGNITKAILGENIGTIVTHL